MGPALLLLAILPSMVYLDHWVEYAGRALGVVVIEDPGAMDTATHANHCHLGPSSCSDQPVPASPQGFAVIVELTQPELQAFALVTNEARLEEFTPVPLTEPPRA
jgi:hypothetical protein